MPDPVAASTKVINRLMARFDELTPGTGITFYKDRDEEESFQPAELPAGVLIVNDLDFRKSTGEMGVQLCTMDLELVLYSKGNGIGIIDEANQRALAYVNNKIMEDWTLGGWLESLDILNSSGSKHDAVFIGACVLNINLSFRQRASDFFVGIAAGGVEF